QAGTGAADAMPRSLEEVGDAAITAALARHNGRVAAAARELGIHRATLYRRIAQLKHTTPARPN
ncbi:MAG TPA: helix-turn-helix domain-containing protein, partial [Rhodocyclaceae bacterium]|nr:helix-turn-helix domain-containing protein [Rhodocyclaceae bacterium]